LFCFSDSGGIQEEAIILKKKCVIPSNYTPHNCYLAKNANVHGSLCVDRNFFVTGNSNIKGNNNTDQNANYNDLSMGNIYYAKTNFNKMLKIIYDYGFKLLYVIDNNQPDPIDITPPPVNHNINLGGSNNYYDKYVKYKTKYLKNTNNN
jgi:hypothetical protein